MENIYGRNKHLIGAMHKDLQGLIRCVKGLTEISERDSERINKLTVTVKRYEFDKWLAANPPKYKEGQNVACFVDRQFTTGTIQAVVPTNDMNIHHHYSVKVGATVAYLPENQVTTTEKSEPKESKIKQAYVAKGDSLKVVLEDGNVVNCVVGAIFRDMNVKHDEVYSLDLVLNKCSDVR